MEKSATYLQVLALLVTKKKHLLSKKMCAIGFARGVCPPIRFSLLLQTEQKRYFEASTKHGGIFSVGRGGKGHY